jgi:hypothetical protein
MWDEADGFFYDVLRLPDGSASRLRVRSVVGLLPLCASTVFGGEDEVQAGRVLERVRDFVGRHPKLLAGASAAGKVGVNGRRLLSPLDERKLTRMLGVLLDEDELLSPHGIRALSRYHLEHPYEQWVNGQRYRVEYLPAESDSGMFGGNSNWRGPVWFPMNALLIRALLHLYAFYGDDFTVECPTGSGRRMSLYEVAREIAERLIRIFLRGPDGRRPVYGGQRKFQDDPHWRDLIWTYDAGGPKLRSNSARIAARPSSDRFLVPAPANLWCAMTGGDSSAQSRSCQRTQPFRAWSNTWTGFPQCRASSTAQPVPPWAVL